MLDLEIYCAPAICISGETIDNANLAFLNLLGYQGSDRNKVQGSTLSMFTDNKTFVLSNCGILNFIGCDGKSIKTKYSKLVKDNNIYILNVLDKEQHGVIEPLTGSYTRYYLEKNIDALSKYENEKFVLVGLNLKSFKHVNSILGLDVGDMILQELAKRLKDIAPKDSMVFRSYADVFVILLKGGFTKLELQMLVKDILNKCEQDFNICKHSISCRFAAGVAIYPNSGINSNDLIKHLDFSINKSKETGVPEFFYHEKLEEYRLYLSVVSDIEKAIENGEFTIVYQPIVSYRGGESFIVGVESLIRWFHKKHNFIPPDYFIKIAEDIGIIDRINIFVFNRVLSDLEKFNIPTHCEEFKVSINLSLRVQNIPSHLIDISKIIREFDCKDKRIKLQIEFTETAISEDESSKQVLRMFMRECKAQGVDFAMDDFGVEYSSINRLLEFNFDVIKIDKQFVQRIGGFDDTNTIHVIDTILSLAKKLRYKVVAEGVETIEQVEVLDDLDCDYYQGYLFYKPLNLSDLLVNLSE